LAGALARLGTWGDGNRFNCAQKRIFILSTTLLPAPKNGGSLIIRAQNASSNPASNPIIAMAADLLNFRMFRLLSEGNVTFQDLTVIAPMAPLRQ